MKQFKIMYNRQKAIHVHTLIERSLPLAIEKLKNWQGQNIEILSAHEVSNNIELIKNHSLPFTIKKSHNVGFTGSISSR